MPKEIVCSDYIGIQKFDRRPPLTADRITVSLLSIEFRIPGKRKTNLFTSGEKWQTFFSGVLVPSEGPSGEALGTSSGTKTPSKNCHFSPSGKKLLLLAFIIQISLFLTFSW